MKIASLVKVRSDGTERLYAYGPEGFAAQMTVGGGIEYPLLDGLGSLRQLTDNNGAIVLYRSYDAFGTIRASGGTSSSRLGFTGELQDSVTGLVYLRARHYHPVLGRFLQRDSFAGFQQRSQSLNRYSYTENNPVVMVDPSGHFPVFLVTAAIGGLAGAGGSILGQYIATGQVKWTDVGVALGVGILAGAAAPYTLTMAGAVGVNAAAGFIQYSLTQWVNGDPFDWTDAGINVLIGGIAGRITGPFLPYDLLPPLNNPNKAFMGVIQNAFRTPPKFDPNSPWLSQVGRRTIQQLIDQEVAESIVAKANLIRSGFAGFYANLPWPSWLHDYFEEDASEANERRMCTLT